MKIFVLSLLAFGLSACIAEKARFDNYRVYSIAIETKEQLDLLMQLEEISDSVSVQTVSDSKRFELKKSFSVQLLGFAFKAPLDR